MVRPLWQLLLEDSLDLTCDECFALMEYYAELLARDGVGLLPVVMERLKRCAYCEPQYRESLRCLLESQSETSATSLSDLTGSYGSEQEE
jgi:hypothetical protein